MRKTKNKDPERINEKGIQACFRQTGTQRKNAYQKENQKKFGLRSTKYSKRYFEPLEGTLLNEDVSHTTRRHLFLALI